MPSVTIPVPPATTLAICTLISLSLIGFLVYTVLSSPNPYKDRLREKVLIKPEPGEIPNMKVFHREKKLLLMLDSDERGTAKFRILSNQSLLHGRQGRGELVCHPPEDLSDIATKSYQGLPMFVTIGTSKSKLNVIDAKGRVFRYTPPAKLKRRTKSTSSVGGGDNAKGGNNRSSSRSSRSSRLKRNGTWTYVENFGKTALFLDKATLIQLDCGKYLALNTLTNQFLKSFVVIHSDGSLRYSKTRREFPGMAESQWQPYCGADLGQGNALVLGATLPRREENLALIRSLVYNVNNNTFDHLSPLRSRVAFPEVMCGAYQADAAAASEAGQPGGTSRRFIGLVFSSRKLVGIEEFDPRTKRWRLLKGTTDGSLPDGLHRGVAVMPFSSSSGSPLFIGGRTIGGDRNTRIYSYQGYSRWSEETKFTLLGNHEVGEPDFEDGVPRHPVLIWIPRSALNCVTRPKRKKSKKDLKAKLQW